MTDKKRPSTYGTPKEESYILSGKRAAPSGKFRLLEVDTLSGPFADTLVGDFDSKDDAIRECNARARKFRPCYCYDDQGELVHSAGSPS